MLTDLIVYILHLIFAHPFFYMVAYIVLIFGMAFLMNKDAKLGKARFLFILGFLLIFINFFAGHYLNASLIHWAGETGAAKITDGYSTSTRYNNQSVQGYQTLIKTRDGKIVETSFEDDDFNVYPYHNRVIYPSTGDQFNVSYLKHFPTAFVIITNDNSPWASGQSCAELKEFYKAAINKYSFDRNNPDYRKACIQVIQNIISQHCYSDSTDLKKYKGDMAIVNQGKAFE